MCYPLPAPRCSPHAIEKLRSAEETHRTAPPSEQAEAQRQLEEARQDFYTTTAGLKELKAENRQSDYAYYKHRREQLIEAYKHALLTKAVNPAIAMDELYRLLNSKNTPKKVREAASRNIARRHPIWNTFPEQLAVGMLLEKGTR